MAWIENEFGQVMMVRQTQGAQLWALPGGKLHASEDLEKCLRREIREETGLALDSASLAAVYDRFERNSFVVLYRVTLKKGEPSIKRPQEISQIEFKTRMPTNGTPSAKHFWQNRDLFSEG